MWGWECSSMVELLPSMPEATGLIPSIIQSCFNWAKIQLKAEVKKVKLWMKELSKRGNIPFFNFLNSFLFSSNFCFELGSRLMHKITNILHIYKFISIIILTNPYKNIFFCFRHENVKVKYTNWIVLFVSGGRSLFWDRVSLYIAQSGIKFMPVFLLQFPECWNYRCAPTTPDSQKDILKRLFSNIFQDIANKFTQSTHHIKHVQK